MPLILRAGSIFPWIPCILLLVSLVQGCAADRPRPDESGRQTVVDDLGRSVSVRLPVRRVVTLAPSVTEILYAAGGLSTLVGVSTADDYPPSVTSLPAFSALPVNFEAIVALQPDLVLATTQVNNPRDAKVLDELEVPIFFLRTQSLNDVLRNVRTVGMLVGTEKIAFHTADSLGRIIERLRNATDTLSSRPRVLVLLSEEKLFSFGIGSYIHDLIDLAGGKSITAQIERDAPILSEEFILVQRPDVILGTFPEHVGVAEILSFHPEWSGIPAIISGSVFAIPPDILLRPGPRNIEGSLKILAVLHPDIAETLRLTD